MQCVAYVRTSNKNHADEKLRMQKELIKDFVLEKGWKLTYVYV
ncbi:recombinase family protein [Ureibacillus sp. FSL W8-0352]